MFEQIQSGFTRLFRQLRGIPTFSPSLLDPLLKDLRVQLLEADVALSVVEDFLQSLRTRLLDREGSAQLTAEQFFAQQVHGALTELLGPQTSSLALPPAPQRGTLLFVGLQGAGKTTSLIKLAVKLKKAGRNPLTCSLDFSRPAAREQLRGLAERYEIPYFRAPVEGSGTKALLHQLRQAQAAAQREGNDLLFLDTAGRLHGDDALLDELAQLQAQAKPDETLLVVDSMLGQDAARSCLRFKDRVDLTGAILTKLDGDARAGAALSLAQLAKVPIKFLGTGERAANLETFHAERLASRIMGMGDLMGLVESMDPEPQNSLLSKLEKQESFTLDDFRQQLLQAQKMGGIPAILERLPQELREQPNFKAKVGEIQLKKNLAIMDSMTPKERHDPSRLRSSQKRRIAKGSGTETAAVNALLRQYESQRELLKHLSTVGMGSLLAGFGKLGLSKLPGLGKFFKG